MAEDTAGRVASRVPGPREASSAPIRPGDALADPGEGAICDREGHNAVTLEVTERAICRTGARDPRV